MRTTRPPSLLRCMLAFIAFDTPRLISPPPDCGGSIKKITMRAGALGMLYTEHRARARKRRARVARREGRRE